MTTSRPGLRWLTLPLLLVAATAAAQTTEIEIGYRWLDLGGSEAMYRSQINERGGFILRAFTMTSAADSPLADRFRIDATDLGATPAGLLRLEAAKDGAYLLRLAYRAADAYSAVPGFANPLLSQGIVPGQHTLDRDKTSFDADLELIPGHRFSPFVGYSFHRTDGPGRTTYFVGQDEFRLTSDLRDTDQEIRAGATFNLGRVYGQVTQGWRDFRGREDFALDAGEASGNNTVPILGRNVTISSFSRDSRTGVSAPFTNAFVAGDVNRRVRLVGSFVYFSAETDGMENEALTGSFVSFPLGRFFNGLTETIGSRATNETWRGEGRAEIVLRDGIDFIAGYRREHRQLTGAAVIDSLFIDTVTFAGSGPGDLAELHDAKNAIERDDDTLSATISARALGPFAVRAGYSQTSQDITLIPDPSQIVLTGNASGTFQRTVRTFDTTGTYSKSGLTLGASWRHDQAGQPVFRTDFTDRDRFRLRATFGRGIYRVGATAEQIDQTNDQPGVGLDSTIRQYSGDVSVNPIEALQLRASASRFKVDSIIGFRRPETFAIESSIYAESGTSFEGGVSFLRPPFTFDVNGGRFENEGTTPFTVDRLRARVVYDFLAKTGIAAEWSRDEFVEGRATFGDFDATRFGLFLRFRP
ncbi:MAG TPA: hypothetical protein VNA04_02455 [Thermoanaerobaculia bacterium]|nr:hypothetical protein [Thermoanaerobaculia bacterium]